MTIVSNVVALSADRHEVQSGAEWDRASGSDFFFEPNAAELTAGNVETLADFGWTTTSLSFTGGTGADFLSSSDVGVPGHFATNAASDLLQSPDLFGDFSHGHQAAHHLGDVEPTVMVCEFWAAFSVASNNETATAIGFSDAGGSIITATDAIATVYSDGTNFGLRSSADSDAGALVDTNWHRWEIRISQGTTDAIEWFIDGTSQGTIDGRTDVYPASWGAGVQAAGANRVLIGSCRIYYR